MPIENRALGEPVFDRDGSPTHCRLCAVDGITTQMVWIRSVYEGSEFMRGCPRYRLCKKNAKPNRGGWGGRRPTPKVEPEPKPEPPSGELSSAQLESLLSAVGGHVAAEVAKQTKLVTAELSASMAAELAKLRAELGGPQVITWKQGERTIYEIEGKRPHACVGEILRLINCGFDNVFLYGPPGTGKSTSAEHVAEALKLPVYAKSMAKGCDESEFVGLLTPNITGGEPMFLSTLFIERIEEGGVILLDEADNSDPAVITMLNTLLANGYINLNRPGNEKAVRHKDCIILAAANTNGGGATAQFPDREKLDGATMDRFKGSMVEVDYDRDLETALVPDEEIRLRIWAMRDKCKRLSMARYCGTRSLIAAAKLVGGGFSRKEAFQRLMLDWTDDERSKMGEVWR